MKSALGEPLRAEIDIPDINVEEAASLHANVASPDAYKAAGLEYNPAVTRLQITLQRRPDGRSYLSLRSDRVVNDPFIDVLLEANWSTGRIVRDYTMLFDPNMTRQLPPIRPTAPQVSSSPYTPTPSSTAASRRAPARTAPASGAVNQITVNRGDTAGRIAAANKPDNVSLDQMLVALLRTNPRAFIDGNVNRLRAGAVLSMPDAQQAGTTPTGEARRTIIAQSRDFNEFRHKLAEAAPATEMAASGRTAGGQVQANVEEKAPATASPDKLTLSKGAVQGKAGEDQALAERKAKDAEARVAELSKNITELNKLEAASTAAGSAAPALAASAAEGGVPVAVGTVSPPAATAASAATAPAAAVVASAPATAKAPPKPAPEASFMSGLFDNPLIPVAGGGLIVLLAALGFYRARQRRKANQVDSSFLESRLQPDSFFGSSGGQSVDTSKTAAPSSSMVYSASQLDAAGDVDPVAEADVYLAYGRDLQAEEILKEAMRTNPSRAAIPAKLLEIYAKRRDVKT
ncbi:MAG: FimV/HubP family polar landmark protein, partial [Rhodoferax sp.]